jgi:hypothetical protein
MQTRCYNHSDLIHRGKQVNSHLSAFYKDMYDTARSIDSPVILELGTQRGKSATVFLAACEETGGTLVSVDREDCSDIANAPNFVFVQSDSTDWTNILRQAPILSAGIDILYIDTTRVRSHLEKEVASWWPFIKQEGWLFCTTVDPGRYQRGGPKDNIVLERETEERERSFKEFFLANQDSCALAIHYGAAGLAALRKWSPMGTPCNPPVPLPVRSIGSRAWYAARKAAESVRRAVPRVVSGLIR